MTDDNLLLSLETTIQLNDDARVEWLEARDKVLFGGADDREVTRLKVLQRAYVDEQRSAEKRDEPLSVRLRKLWAERDDFSRFRASELTTEDAEETASSEADDLGINLEGLIDESNGVAGEKRDDEEVDVEGKAEQSGDVMTIEEMRQLRTDMLQRLGIAHNSVYFSHALVSLLINSTRAAASADGGSGGDRRAGSAASVSAIAPAAARLGGMAAAAAASASGFQRSMAGAAPSVGSTSSLEAELGIESHIFGASKVEAHRRQFEKRIDEDTEHDVAKTGDEGEEGDEEDAAKEAAVRARYDSQLLDNEVSDHARDLVERFEGKVQGLRSAVDILRKGASTLQPDDRASKHEKTRWQTLVRARQAGWGITPGKPARGTAAGKRELLPDLSGRRKDEPARDAWIGYGVPESHPLYRRRALAYVAHTAPSDVVEPMSGLLFAARPSKRVRVEVAIGTEVWQSQSASEMDVTSIDIVLRTAQTQMFDAELFDTVVAESRALLSSGMVPVTIEDEDAVSFQINPNARLRVCRSEDHPAAMMSETQTRHESPLVSSMLAYLRLGLISRYRERAGVGKASSEANDEPVIAPLLQPVLGVIHYASFVAHLNAILSSIAGESQTFDVQYEVKGFQNGIDESLWLRHFFQGSGKGAAMRAVEQLGGTATVSVAGSPLAHITLAYPSKISLVLAFKFDAKGVRTASVTLTSLRSALEKELKSRSSG